MNRKNVYTVLSVALFSCAAILTTSPAQALPYPDTDQSVIITYYSDSTRGTEIGWRQYGYCGENYDIGVHTRYFTVEVATCLSSALEQSVSTQATTASKQSIIYQRRFPLDFPLCWDVHDKPCHSRDATQSCTDGTFDDYVCTCTASWRWQCPEVR